MINDTTGKTGVFISIFILLKFIVAFLSFCWMLGE